jgi:hypothetical protein
MRKPETDENDVQMSDVLCDYCGREWTEALAMIEGHRGSCICGNCLAIAYREVVLNNVNSAGDDYACTMCLESGKDRAALQRTGEAGWRSPVHDEKAICRRCVKLAAGALTRDAESGWRRPTD